MAADMTLAALGFSAAVGVFFGFYPASMAASFKPDRCAALRVGWREVREGNADYIRATNQAPWTRS